MASTLNQELTGMLYSQLGQLKTLAPDALRRLPQSETKEIIVQGKKIRLTVWRENLTEDRVLIIVQLYRYIVLGMGRMFVDGFVLHSDGRITTAEDRLIWDYT